MLISAKLQYTALLKYLWVDNVQYRATAPNRCTHQNAINVYKILNFRDTYSVYET